MLSPTARRSRPQWLDPQRLALIARVLDVASLTAGFLLGSGLLAGHLVLHPAALAVGLLLAERLLHPAGRAIQADTTSAYWRMLMAAATGLGAALLLHRLGSDVLPQPQAIATLCLAVVACLLLGRIGFAALLRHCRQRGWLARNIVVVGAGDQGRRFIEHLGPSHPDRRIVGVFDDRLSRVPGWVAGFPVLGTIEDLIAFSRRHDVDEVVLALPWTADARVSACLDQLRRVAADIHLSPDLAAFDLAGRPLATVDGLPAIAVHQLGGRVGQRLAKAILDRALALLALAFCAPLMLVLATIALLTCGRLLARDVIQDSFGRPIELHAFAFAGERATPATAALVRLGLHRLPRLFDILLGRVSFIGPRSHETLRPDQRRAAEERLAPYRLKPGLLSPADVEPAGKAGVEARLQREEAYAAGWSIGRDIRLLARAVL
jgi:lipopolysaccharide/colanic/teichoic acid biosynthesis glycosyltransferase